MSELKAKKSLGQHFLNDQKVVTETVKSATIQPGELVIEIGPGTGILTAELLKTGVKVLAYEKDRRAIDILQKKFASEIAGGNLKLIDGDFLESDHVTDVMGSSYKIVANIPYYITGAIIRKSLEAREQPISIILMVQKEVGERIALKDGKHSLLSLSVWLFGEAKVLFDVPSEAFTPAPKVDSVVIVIDKINRDFFLNLQNKIGSEMQVEDVYEKVFQIIRTGFAHKRKKLLSNLIEFETGQINMKEIFQQKDMDENIRAEDLSLDQWKNLIECILTH